MRRTKGKGYFDRQYLRLDTSNDPLTADLDLDTHKLLFEYTQLVDADSTTLAVYKQTTGLLTNFLVSNLLANSGVYSDIYKPKTTLAVLSHDSGDEFWFKSHTGVALNTVAKLKAGQFQFDVINEMTAGAGATIDGVLLKDGDVDVSAGTKQGIYTTNLLLKEHSSTFMRIRNRADTADRDLYLQSCHPIHIDFQYGGGYGVFDTATSADHNVRFRSGNPTTECARLVNKEFGISRAGDITLLDDKFIQFAKDSDGVLPAASATYRGKTIRVEGAAGVADHRYECAKLADDSYAWIQIY